MQLKQALLASATALGSIGAFAVTPGNLGVIDNTSVVIGNNVSGPFFFDTYKFTLTSDSTVSGGAFSFNIGSFAAVLQDASMTTIGTDSTPSDGFTFSGLAAGHYALTFLGFPTSAGAAYGGVITTVPAAVPEPETYALMLGGLGVVGFLATRRRNGA